MTCRKTIGIILAMLGMLPELAGQSYFFGTPFIKSYTTEDFKGGIQSWFIRQDRRDILYVANNFGLLEHDGTTWNLYPVKNGTKVRSVYIGAGEKIYVGSQADFGFFSPDSRGTLQYHSLADSLEEAYRNFDEVWRIYEWDDHIYFLTFRNIYCYQAGRPLRVIEPGSPLEFSFFVKNRIYCQQWGKGLSILEEDSLRILPGGAFFAGRQIASILPYDRASLLVLTAKDGLYLYDDTGVRPFAAATDPLLQSAVINQAILLKDGSFAIGTQNNGLIIMGRDGRVQLSMNRENGLPDQTVLALYQDTHQNLWLGLNNGITMVELSSPFSLIDGTLGLAGTGYAALQAGKEVYLGTNNGLFYMDTEDTGQRSFREVANSTGQVYHLSQIGHDLLMGHHNGPFLIHDKKAERLHTETGVWQFIPVPHNPGLVLMGSYTGLSLMRREQDRLAFVRKYDGFEESSRVLAFGAGASLWMAHGYKGVFRMQFDPAFEKITALDFYNSEDGFPADHLNNMERIRNELIFPALFGIFRYDPAGNRFVRDPQFSAYFNPQEHIVEMEEDVLGNIYFISNERVGRLSFDKFGQATLDTRIFNKIKDLLNDDLSVIHVIDAGNVLFGAKNGFIHYNAGRIKDLQEFHTHLTQIVSTAGGADSLMRKGRRIHPARDFTLPYKLNSLRFAYSSSFYEDADKTAYQYYLENFDAGWSEWTPKTEKEYTNLPEGEYVFHVRARNIYGTLSEAERFTFRIEPPFYRSRLAYFIYSVSAMFLLTFAFYQLDKRFKKEKRLMMLKQERELHKKDTEIKQITDQSEQEIVRLKNEKLQAEIDHINRELTSSTIHLINKNELMTAVKRDLEQILKSNGREKNAAGFRKIIHTIDQNINSDNDWKQFELHFNHVHDNFTDRLLEKYPQLTPQEIKLSAYLRLNLTTKEIAHLLNISVRGVEISRYRLRKKLQLARNENLTDFMLRF